MRKRVGGFRAPRALCPKGAFFALFCEERKTKRREQKKKKRFRSKMAKRASKGGFDQKW